MERTRELAEASKNIEKIKIRNLGKHLFISKKERRNGE
jgi:hypothetical protein